MHANEGHIAIVDRVHPYLVDALENHGIKVVYEPDCNTGEVKNLLNGAIGLVIRSKAYINEEFLGENRPLFIARAGSGMDNLDETALEAMGIHLINAPEGNRDAVAEQTIGMLLNLSARITKSNYEVKSEKWDREGNRGWEIGNRTIGIIGYGNCGSTVASKLQGFNMEILAYDKYKSGFGNDAVKEAEMDELYEKCDIVTFHIPLTEETEGMINSELVHRFRKDLVLLNLSRGKIMNTPDLVQLLDEGKIMGLGLDVLENEDLENMNESERIIFKNLNSRNNVIITPHVGGWTEESFVRISEILAEKILDFTGKVKKNVKEADEIAGKV